MKTIAFLTPGNLVASLAGLAFAGMLLMPAPTSAQGRGATMLLPKPKPATVATKQSETVTAVCSQCKDRLIVVVQTPARGVGVETKKIVRHECTACEQKQITRGHGKTKTTRNVHLCQQMDRKASNCCAGK